MSPPIPEDDDLWGGDEDEQQHETKGLDREWQARREEFWNSGYREGLEAGKHETAQEGFDQGYRLGTAAGHEWGVVRGAVLTLQAAAARGFVSTAEACAAAGPITALAPGEAQRSTCRDLMRSNDGNDGTAENTGSAANIAGGNAALPAADTVRQKAEEEVRRLGFALQPHWPLPRQPNVSQGEIIPP